MPVMPDHAVLAEVVAVALNLFCDDGARADEAHIALDDVPKLRQLVEAGLSEEGAELRDARVVLELEVCLPLLACLGIVLEVLLEGLLCVRDHSLELVARKELAVLTDALMRKDDMALVVDGHNQEERQQDGRNEYTTQGRADEVKTALDEAVPLAGQVVLECQHEDLFADATGSSG